MAVLAEERVIDEWVTFVERGRGLVTERDGPVTVLVPGRRNDDHGPDFRDAILATCHGITVGDIEVHTLSSGWRAHGHDKDPAYNRVVLHVVFRHDTGRDAVLQNGRTVPTFVLGSHGTVPAASPPDLPATDRFLPCRNAMHAPDEIGAALDEAGLARFEEHAAACQSALNAGSEDQVLYAGLLAALGYRRNRAPMARLAVDLPLAALLGLGPAAVEGRLLGAAGLLPSQRTRCYAGAADSPWTRRLEAARKKSGGVPPLSEADWHHAGVRPGNYPGRRLAGLARLLARYRDAGLANGLLAGLAAASGPKEMAALVAVPAEGFWKDHLDFGLPAAGRAPALCGAGRAADIVVNVLLPFAAAWYRRNGYREGERASVNAYTAHPALADNIITEEVGRRLGQPRPVTAVRQQGMLHLHKSYCEAGRCRACPLG